MYTVITEGNLSDEQVVTEFATYAEAVAFASTQTEVLAIERYGITLAHAA